MTTLEPSATRRFIAERMRARRDRLGFTQADIASFLDVDPVTISNYERAVRPLSAEDLPRLAKALHTTVGYFYGEDTEEEQQADDFIRYYKGAPPVLQEAAMNVLRTMHREDDMEQ